MIKIKLDSGEFEKQIRLFSQYLVYSNQDYNYNETYLENFCFEFINLKKYVGIKNPIFRVLTECITKIFPDLKFQLFMDQFWIYSSVDNREHANTNINVKEVCREETSVKMVLSHDNKRYMFFKEYKVIEEGKLLDDIELHIFRELSGWIKDIYNGKEN